ncbi:hypothetical protein CFP56_035963 [Quercus suber]|uniref:Uncharacterized protein n=1 Tax=Quercus suber TaxID=58331 RepID=A0AAW0J802_QUESU
MKGYHYFVIIVGSLVMIYDIVRRTFQHQRRLLLLSINTEIG